MAYGSPLAQRLYFAAPWRLQQVMASFAGLRHRRASRGPYFRSWLSHLLERQFVSSEEQRDMAWRRLTRILEFAARETVYYGEMFAQLGVAANDIRSFEHLNYLPTLSKEDVRARSRHLISRPFRSGHEMREIHTSGTTGKALKIWLSQECYEREYAYRALHYSWAGLTLDDKCAVFAGHPVVHVDDEKPPFWRYDRAEHRLLFSSQHLFPEFARLYVEALEQFQPVVIHGYPSSVTWMAEALLKCGTERVRPRAVFTASETVLPHQRAIIERAFGCKMFNWYGNGEHIACITECPSGGLHIQSEHSWLEFLDENGRPAAAGVPARLVATTLGNFAMPLIRYDIGDLVTMSDRTCDCGRKTALVEAIEGRVEDYIVGKEGRIFGRLDHIFKDMDAISEAQIVQHESGSIRIRLVRRPHYTEHDTKVLLSAARFRLGSDFRIDLEFVDRIPRRANGKFQFVVTSSRPV